MRHSGLSFLGHLLPFGLIVALQMSFCSNEVDFIGEKCQANRFGNSGLFLVFSKEVQEKLQESRRQSREWSKQHDEEEEREKLKELQNKYSDEKEA